MPFGARERHEFAAQEMTRFNRTVKHLRPSPTIGGPSVAPTAPSSERLHRARCRFTPGPLPVLRCVPSRRPARLPAFGVRLSCLPSHVATATFDSGRMPPAAGASRSRPGRSIPVRVFLLARVAGSRLQIGPTPLAFRVGPVRHRPSQARRPADGASRCRP